MNTVISADGTIIAYTQTGTGPALILIDGALCYRGAGPATPLAALLASQFTTFTYDRRGRGESSDTSPWAVEREVDDLEALIAAAGGTAHLYGVSSGAMLALLAAERGVAVGRLGLFEPPFPAGAWRREAAAQPVAGPPVAAQAVAAQPVLGASRHEASAEPVAARPVPGTELHQALAELVAAGRNGEALEHFQLAIGLPRETVIGMRQAPFRPALEAIAPTLVYDTAITTSLPLSRLSTIDNPALVIASADSADGLHTAAKAASEALPNACLVHLPGRFHDVPAEDLAPVLADFFTA
jgi:pimeloyl-ACP methyl ester carboxylesterase